MLRPGNLLSTYRTVINATRSDFEVAEDGTYCSEIRELARVRGRLSRDMASAADL